MQESVTTPDRYHIVIADASKNPVGILIANKREFFLPGERMLRPLDLRTRGFSHFSGLRPLLVYIINRRKIPERF